MIPCNNEHNVVMKDISHVMIHIMKHLMIQILMKVMMPRDDANNMEYSSFAESLVAFLLYI